MQYLAIMDAEELVFLDGERKCLIEIDWCRFHPKKRTALDGAARGLKYPATEIKPSPLLLVFTQLGIPTVPFGGSYRFSVEFCVFFA